MEDEGSGDPSVMRVIAVVSLIVGCGAGPSGPIAPAAEARSAAGASRCTVVLVSDAADAVARIGGGAFVLREGGRLERYDRDGLLAGVAETELRSLAPAGAYVCGEAGAGVLCFRDRREDLTCRSAPFAPELEAVEVPGGPLSGDPDDPVVRVGGTAWEISGTCEQHCVSLGCDEPRSCMDPCPSGVRPRLFARLVSNNRTARVTHPSK